MLICRHKGLLLGAILLLSLGFVRPVLAHGYIVRAIPGDRVVLQHAPARLQYWFSEPLEPEFSSLNVRDQNGVVIASGAVSEDDASLMAVRLPSDLPDGAYIVELRPAFASDGHVVAESRVFFVGEEVGGVSGAAASVEAQPLEVVWRALVLAATILLFGAYTVYAGVLVPAWGSKQHPAGLLPPRVMRRLNWIVGLALAGAFAGNLLALLQQTMVFFGAEVGQVFAQGLWDVVRIGSRFGDIWNARLTFLVLIAVLHAASVYLRKDYPEAVRAFWTANAWLVALIIGTSSAASHASGSLLWPWLGIAIDWLHALAVAFWAGGIMALVLILPVALLPYDGQERRTALLVVMRRFSRMVVAAVLIVITTGIYNASNWIYTPADMTQTTFGGALLLKVLLAALLLLVGALHHAALRPAWIERISDSAGTGWRGWLARPVRALLARAGRFTGSLRLEGIVVLVVLASVGLLSATPVPQPDFLNKTIETPTQTRTIGDYTVTMAISPGGPGVNTYDVQVWREGAMRDVDRVSIQMVNPVRDWRGLIETAEPVDTGLYVTVGDEIDRVGRWWSLVDIEDGISPAKQRVAFDWDITAEASVISSRDPDLFNLLALTGVLVALGWAVYPAARRYAARLDLSPLAVTVALGVTGIALALIVFAFLSIEQTQRQYQETLYPPPDVVNTVLPNAESLARGAQLYTEHCIAWQSAADFGTLRDGTSRIRDDELFKITRQGWRSLPACTGELDDTARWDVVNYFRTLDRSQ